ncbi:hypothetical protein LTR86_004443 [Recurvomyces mirabilis]|nr:hypothetical protein LTR86_004443 [Recurvomyces mirabilis]
MPRGYSRDSVVDDDGKQPVVKCSNKRNATAEDDLAKKRSKRETVRWPKAGRPGKTTHRVVLESIPELNAEHVAALSVMDDMEPLELDEAQLQLDEARDTLEALLPNSTTEDGAVVSSTLDISLAGLFEKGAAGIPPYRADDNPNAARSWRADCNRPQRQSFDFESPAMLKVAEETEAGYLPEDLYNFELEEDDDARFSTITTMPNADMGLALFAKPSTNAGRKSYDLYQIQYVWRGTVEDRLMRSLQPSGIATHWGRKVIRALAGVAYYGTAEDINRLLWQEVSSRRVWAGSTVIKVDEVYEVIRELEAKGIEPRKVSDVDFF